MPMPQFKSSVAGGALSLIGYVLLVAGIVGGVVSLTGRTTDFMLFYVGVGAVGLGFAAIIAGMILDAIDRASDQTYQLHKTIYEGDSEQERRHRSNQSPPPHQAPGRRLGDVAGSYQMPPAKD